MRSIRKRYLFLSVGLLSFLLFACGQKGVLTHQPDAKVKQPTTKKPLTTAPSKVTDGAVPPILNTQPKATELPSTEEIQP